MSSARQLALFVTRWSPAVGSRSHRKITPSISLVAHVQISDKLKQNQEKSFTRSQSHTLDPCTHGARVDPLCCRVFLPSFQQCQAFRTRDQRLRDGNIKRSAEVVGSAVCCCFFCCNRSSGFWMFSSIPNASTFNNLFQS